MYILGVDGGSTKIDFALATLDGEIIKEIRIYEPSNLKYVGPENVIKNLKKGFEGFEESGYDLKDVKSAYFGIAECGPKSGVSGRGEVLDFIDDIFNKFTLADDQYSVFYSLSRTPYGILANAGTGSNINYFFEGGEKTYKSLGHGGRDFGKLVLAQIKYGNYDENSEVFKIVEDFLGMSPVLFYNSLSAEEFIISKEITQISKVLYDQCASNSGLKKELDFLLVNVADRWGSKISAYCWANFGLREYDEFDIVLTGSMWRWSRIESIATSEIRKVFKDVNIIQDCDSKPVVGCIKLAKKSL